MRLLVIANGIVGEKPGLSGGETRFIEIAKAWAQQGHEIHLLSSRGGHYLCRQFGLTPQLHSVSELTATKRWVFFVRFFESLFRLPATLRGLAFDAVFSSSEQIYDVLPAWLLQRRGQVKKWGVVTHWLPPFPPWRRTNSTLFNATAFFCSERLGLRLAERAADLLLPVSEDTARQLRAAGIAPDRFTTVECGVAYDDIRAVCEPPPAKTVDAVFMKRLQAVKGVFDLIDIWRRVIARKPDATLLVIGEGIDGDAMRAKVKELGLAQNIRFTGTIYDFQTKFRSLASARLFVLPSHEENWAIVIGEAMAAGTPVICYGLEELKSVWQDCCVYVPKPDVAQFADRICDLLERPEDRTALSMKALAYVQRYAWSRIADRELSLLVTDSRSPVSTSLDTPDGSDNPATKRSRL